MFNSPIPIPSTFNKAGTWSVVRLRSAIQFQYPQQSQDMVCCQTMFNSPIPISSTKLGYRLLSDYLQLFQFQYSQESRDMVCCPSKKWHKLVETLFGHGYFTVYSLTPGSTLGFSIIVTCHLAEYCWSKHLDHLKKHLWTFGDLHSSLNFCTGSDGLDKTNLKITAVCERWQWELCLLDKCLSSWVQTLCDYWIM